jgi:nicotinamide riboside kinase
MRIIITGTESTGKTTLAEELSQQMHLPLVTDVSREWIAQLNRPYTENDVLNIAREIIRREEQARQSAQLFITDNDLINIKIWLEYYNWKVPDWIENQIQGGSPSFYLLCYIDTPWVQDEQRANPNDRQQLYDLFLMELEQLKAPYKVLKGSPEDRFTEAAKEIQKLL